MIYKIKVLHDVSKLLDRKCNIKLLFCVPLILYLFVDEHFFFFCIIFFFVFFFYYYFFFFFCGALYSTPAV